jgi:hypothetical protein
LSQSAFAAARSGASIYYFIEPSAAIAIYCGIVWSFGSKKYLSEKAQIGLVAVFVIFASFSLIQIVKIEYYRWEAIPYLQEIVQRLHDSTRDGDACISSMPELATAAGREYHFGDWLEYNDGRSPELQKVFAQAVESHCYRAIIWDNSYDPPGFPGYHRVDLETPPPEKFPHYDLYVVDE